MYTRFGFFLSSFAKSFVGAKSAPMDKLWQGLVC